jgi:rare lipoprotein A
VSARAKFYVALTLVLAASGLALPALGVAASGGSGLTQPSTPSPTSTGSDGSSPASTGVVQPGNGTVTAVGNGITLATRASAVLHTTMRFSGSVPLSAARSTIELERLGNETQWHWAATANGTVSPGGSFTIAWPTNHIDRFQFRVVLDPGGQVNAASASPALTATVYLPAIATWYGGGRMNGAKTACGEVLRPKTLGVAHRWLKCGTLVAFYYQGKTITVPVIDRGPYANGASWDLTAATAKALGTYNIGVATVGAVSLPPQL